MGYIGMIKEDGAVDAPELRQLAIAHVHDLVALAVGATRDAAFVAQGRGVRAARLHAVKSDITGNLSRGDLTIGAVALRHDISPRYVQMLFESEGTTFSDFVRRQRLGRARAMLNDSRRADLTISQIAYEAGFGDLSHFNRAFRKLYHVSPSEARVASHRRR
jgi:AraC-like DNA-binding protein